MTNEPKPLTDILGVSALIAFIIVGGLYAARFGERQRLCDALIHEHQTSLHPTKDLSQLQPDTFQVTQTSDPIFRPSYYVESPAKAQDRLK